MPSTMWNSVMNYVWRHRQPTRVNATFMVNCTAARLQNFEQSQLFRCRELEGHSGYINAVEFSEDGTLLISGGADKSIRLWSVNQSLTRGISSIMETKHQSPVTSLAFSPDNKRIFSGGNDSKIFIHDART